MEVFKKFLTLFLTPFYMGKGNKRRPLNKIKCVAISAVASAILLSAGIASYVDNSSVQSIPSVETKKYVQDFDQAIQTPIPSPLEAIAFGPTFMQAAANPNLRQHFLDSLAESNELKNSAIRSILYDDFGRESRKTVILPELKASFVSNGHEESESESFALDALNDRRLMSMYIKGKEIFTGNKYVILIRSDAFRDYSPVNFLFNIFSALGTADDYSRGIYIDGRKYIGMENRKSMRPSLLDELLNARMAYRNLLSSCGVYPNSSVVSEKIAGARCKQDDAFQSAEQYFKSAGRLIKAAPVNELEFVTVDDQLAFFNRNLVIMSNGRDYSVRIGLKNAPFFLSPVKMLY